MVEIFKKYFYTDTCTVWNTQEVENSETHITEFKEVAILENEPCRISFSDGSIAVTNENLVATQQIKLFLSPSTPISSGSKVIVTRQGEIFNLRASTSPRLYETHQEVTLEKYVNS